MYRKNKIALFLLVVLCITFLAGCSTQNNQENIVDNKQVTKEKVSTGLSDELKKQIDEMEEGEFFYFINNQQVMFEYTNQEIIDMLLYKVKKMDNEQDIFYLIDGTMSVLENRAMSYEYALASMAYSASKYFDDMKDQNFDNIEDRIVKVIAKELHADGYTINNSNGFAMISYEPSLFLDTFKEYLTDSYIDIYNRLYEFRNVETVTDQKMNFDTVIDTILELEGILEENKDSYAYIKVSEFHLDKIRFLMGITAKEFVTNEDDEFLDEYINALKRLEEESPNELLTEAISAILYLTDVHGTYTEAFKEEANSIFEQLATQYYLAGQPSEPEVIESNEDLGTYYENILKYTEELDEVETEAETKDHLGDYYENVLKYTEDMDEKEVENND